jgi:hypothetical protein
VFLKGKRKSRLDGQMMAKTVNIFSQQVRLKRTKLPKPIFLVTTYCLSPTKEWQSSLSNFFSESFFNFQKNTFKTFSQCFFLPGFHFSMFDACLCHVKRFLMANCVIPTQWFQYEGEKSKILAFFSLPALILDSKVKFVKMSQSTTLT